MRDSISVFHRGVMPTFRLSISISTLFPLRPPYGVDRNPPVVDISKRCAALDRRLGG